MKKIEKFRLIFSPKDSSFSTMKNFRKRIFLEDDNENLTLKKIVKDLVAIYEIMFQPVSSRLHQSFIVE